MSRDNKRNLIILGSVLTAVYFAILALGIHNGGKKTSSLDEIKAYQWPALIDKLLSPFAPAVNLAKIKCNGQPVQESFVLPYEEYGESKSSCELNLTQGLEGNKDFWKTEVLLSPATEKDLEVFIKVRYENDLPDKKCETEKPNSPFWLEVEFAYAGQQGNTECWLPSDEKNQIPLTVTKDEGKPTLTLTCVGCTQQQRKIELKMK